jgi:hypothetical protein
MLLIIKDIKKNKRMLLFCCMFLFGITTKAQNNNDSSFYVLDNTLISGKNQVFILSNLNINQQKIYIEINTIFYDSGIVSCDIQYINNIQNNISKNTNKYLCITQNYKNKKLKEKVNNIISNSDNFPIGRKKINVLFAAASTITYSNSNKKSIIVGLNAFNFENLLITQSKNKHDFQNYDKVINCFKINLKLFNRPPPNII